jgi:hypothetical protein
MLDGFCQLAATHPASYYESNFGATLTYIEENAGTNFQGYAFEIIPETCLEWLRARTSFGISHKEVGGFVDSMYTADDGGVYNELTRADGSTATMAQHVALLDEITIEVLYDGMTEQWNQYIPGIEAVYSGKWGFNVDMVCQDAGWSGTPLAGSFVDNPDTFANPYWNCVENSNRTCAQEKSCCLSRCASIYSTLGKKFDYIIYNMNTNPYPYGNSSPGTIPDGQWFIDWAQQNIVPLYLSSTSSATWSQSVTPHCITASSAPGVVSSSSGATWSQTITPHCTTAGSVPTSPIVTHSSPAWTATKVPTSTTASSAPTILVPPTTLNVVRSRIQ